MPKIYELETDYFVFECNACGSWHFFQTAPRLPAWQWNQDFEKPTVTPSIRVTGGERGNNHVCHFFVKNGQIEFCNDSTHEFAGKTVEMLDWEKTDL